MVLDTTLLNTQVCIESKVEQSRERRSTLIFSVVATLECSSYCKGSLLVALDYGRQLYLLIVDGGWTQMSQLCAAFLLSAKLPPLLATYSCYLGSNTLCSISFQWSNQPALVGLLLICPTPDSIFRYMKLHTPLTKNQPTLIYLSTGLLVGLNYSVYYG